MRDAIFFRIVRNVLLSVTFLFLAEEVLKNGLIWLLVTMLLFLATGADIAQFCALQQELITGPAKTKNYSG